MDQNDSNEGDGMDWSVGTAPSIHAETSIPAKCPHCGRGEQFKHKLTAHAWMTGHIQSEHGGELPNFEGTGEDQDSK